MHQQQWLAVIEELGDKAHLPMPNSWDQSRETQKYSYAFFGSAADGTPPMFTDYQYEALGVPRNAKLVINKDPKFFDMGVCGPFRDDIKAQTQYCGMFLTPTLRNAATRQVFFHNGIYHSLDDVMAFYNERNTALEKFYPKGADGKVNKYDDLPPQLHANIDVADAPFDRKLGDQPAMTSGEIRDIIAFLHTLDDGYKQGS